MNVDRPNSPNIKEPKNQKCLNLWLVKKKKWALIVLYRVIRRVKILNALNYNKKIIHIEMKYIFQ